MFDVILNPEANKSKEVLSDSDLKAEAVLMLFAGMDTTSNALVTGTWGLLQNQMARSKLMEELYQAVPHRDSKFDAEMIEKLPYLVELAASPCLCRLLILSSERRSQRKSATITRSAWPTSSNSACIRFNPSGKGSPPGDNNLAQQLCLPLR